MTRAGLERHSASCLSTGSNCMDPQTNLVWIDLEMTGLNVETDVILEIASVVTDADLEVIAEGARHFRFLGS